MNEHFFFVCGWWMVDALVSVADSCTDAPLLLANLEIEHTHTKPNFKSHSKSFAAFTRKMAIDRFSTVISDYSENASFFFPSSSSLEWLLSTTVVRVVACSMISIWCQNPRKFFFSCFFFGWNINFSYYFTWTIFRSSVLSRLAPNSIPYNIIFFFFFFGIGKAEKIHALANCTWITESF